ncbi:MAG TPA: ABC transporter permease [Chitinophagaceae bacterium]|nr:ABC transporter permease [Chitinophagaceae bacterium]
MNKIWLVIKREYLTRVRNKTFLLSTFLFPIIIVAFIIGSTFLAIKSRNKVKIAVIDDPGFLQKNLESDSSSVIFEYPKDVNSSNYESKGYIGLLRVNSDTASEKYVIESKKSLSMETMSYVERQMKKAIEYNMLQQKNIERKVLDSISTASEKAAQVTNQLDTGREANNKLPYIIGFECGIIIYITMFVFGAMVMRGVMEEKTSRIAEVIVSSVKPFQLMMGKILGIAAVGLTQLLLWIIFLMILVNIIPLFVSADTLHQFQQAQQAQQGLPGGSNNTVAVQMLQATDTFKSEVNWWLIIPCFLFYFLGGYLFYAALFASVGSAVNEDPQEAQSLMLPIMMPIVFGFIILSTSIENPDSPMAFWGSMIPFTSPIVMMGRIAKGVPEVVPWWQLFLSMALLILGFIFTTWLAGKIYRTGILMYGKKASWKEMIKWVRRS